MDSVGPVVDGGPPRRGLQVHSGKESCEGATTSSLTRKEKETDSRIIWYLEKEVVAEGGKYGDPSEEAKDGWSLVVADDGEI
ncbi:hypothetical protein GUJ93_ZPchr0010g9529 [Zizania palustris]|uniref:Uncharacterized protein n=1 Tax=Zizania palustris TaxID=103762 RepID=A0A8J5WFW0_ZIZPA|nr:hypothetical protein GUJ93_ZPchr0010g9529 [Zizania palustris]